MSATQSTSTTPLPGDLMQGRARTALLMALAASAASLPVYVWVGPLWRSTEQLQGSAFIWASFGFGLLLVIGPVLAIAGFLTALFMRVESCFVQRNRTRRTDKPVIALSLFVTLLPALAACYPPIKALFTGSIRYKFPKVDVAYAFDPLGYWQGIAFWFMGAAALAWLAFVYWRSRWRKHQALSA